MLSACSGYDVELQGGLFEAAGLSNISKKREEPKLTDRPGIVMPPHTASLPQPGAVPTQNVAANGEAFPVDPEESKKTQTAALIAQHKAFCEKARERQKMGHTEVIENSPWGSCHESILKNFTGKSAWGNKAINVD